MHSDPAAPSGEPRFEVHEVQPAAVAQAGDLAEPAAPFVVYSVVDSETGREVAAYSAADVASGLPPHVRENIAAWRARHHAALLDATHALVREGPEGPPAAA